MISKFYFGGEGFPSKFAKTPAAPWCVAGGVTRCHLFGWSSKAWRSLKGGRAHKSTPFTPGGESDRMSWWCLTAVSWKMVVPPQKKKTPQKLSSFSRKTHGFVGETHHFRNLIIHPKTWIKDILVGIPLLNHNTWMEVEQQYFHIHVWYIDLRLLEFLW